MNFTPTHLTSEGLPVRVIGPAGADHLEVQVRTGRASVYPEREVFPLGSAEAQEILAEVTGQGEALAVAEAIQDRMTVANWARCLGNSRDTLASGIQQALEMDLSWNVRKVLQKALAVAAEDLADFSR